MNIDVYFDMDGTLNYFDNRIESFERLLEKDYFFNLEPFTNVISAINFMLDFDEKEMNIYILTSCINDDAMQQKNRWLDKYIPDLPKENRIFIKMNDEKSGYIKNRNNLNILIDDYNKNLNEFRTHRNCISVKLINNINDSHQTWNGERIFYSSSPFQILSQIKAVALKEMCRINNISLLSVKERMNNSRIKQEKANEISIKERKIRKDTELQK